MFFASFFQKRSSFFEKKEPKKLLFASALTQTDDAACVRALA
jgi:hypothetical protein